MAKSFIKTPIPCLVLLVISLLPYRTNQFSFKGNRISDLEGEGSNFIAEAASWQVPKKNGIRTQSYTLCGDTYILAGPEVEQDGSFHKKYTDLPPHDHIYFSMSVYLIDKWFRERSIAISFNPRSFVIGTFLLDHSLHFLENKCGAPDVNDLEIRLYGKAAHNESSLSLFLQTTVLDDHDEKERFLGFRDVILLFKNSTKKDNKLERNEICGLSSITLPSLECNCPQGQYQAPDGSCQACDPLCETCFGPSRSDCFKCLNGAIFDGKECVLCHESCATCFGASANECLSCPSGYYMFEGTSCRDSCNSPLVQSTVGSTLFCSSPCAADDFLHSDGTCGKTCNSTYNSITLGDKKFCTHYCPDGQYYVPSTAVTSGTCLTSCPAAYYTDITARYCTPCQDSFCISCPNENGGKCAQCKNGAILDSKGVCKEFQSLRVTYIKALDSGHRYRLEIFPESSDLDIKTIQQQLSGNFLSNKDSPPFSLDVLSKSANRFIVDLDLKGSVLQETDFSLSFNNLDGLLTVPKIIVPTPGLQSIAQYAVTGQTIVVMTTAVGFGGAIALGSTAALWSIIGFQQFIGYLAYINTDFPLQVNLFFSLLGSSTWDFLPNPLDSIIQPAAILEDSYLHEMPLPPQKFADDNFTISFIQNGGGIVFTCLLLFTLLALIKLARKIKRFKDNKVFKAVEKNVKWNIIIRTYLESGIPLVLAVFLQIRSFSFDATYLAICSISSILALIYLSAFSVILVIFLYRKSLKDLKAESSEERYGTLWEGILLRTSLSKYYHMLILLRGVLLSVLIVFVEDIPYLQISPLILYNVGVVYYLFKEIVFEDKYLNIINRIKEILILLGEICILGYLFKGGSERHYNMLGWLIVACFFLALFIETVYILGKQIMNIRLIIKKIVNVWNAGRDFLRDRTMNKENLANISRRVSFPKCEIDLQDMEEKKTFNLSS